MKAEAKSAMDVRAFEFKGRMLTLTVINLLSEDIHQFEEQLVKKVAQAPDFFNGTPVVFDLNGFESTDLKSLAEICRQNSLIPVGIMGGIKAQDEIAREIGLAVFPNLRIAGDDPSKKTGAKKADAEKDVEKKNIKENKKTETKLVTEEEPGRTKTVLIKQPVRSGQQVYARGADLVITSSVSAGAEVLADGHIHIYGSLRGRALAGVTGDANARIFCNKLDAELVSVAGQYRLSDDIEVSCKNGAVQIYLSHEQLKIEKTQ